MKNKFPDHPISTLRTDNAKEYTELRLKHFCEQNGIVLDPVIPYSPELNGIAERQNQTIMRRVRAMLIESKLEIEFWAYAVSTATYLSNRSPTRANEGNRTPYELFFEIKPNLKNVKIFGCLVYRHIPVEVRKQMQQKL